MANKNTLATELFQRCNHMIMGGVKDIKSYEMVFQDTIEEICKDKAWWEVTDCDIFTHLLEYKDPQATVIAIIKGLKES